MALKLNVGSATFITASPIPSSSYNRKQARRGSLRVTAVSMTAISTAKEELKRQAVQKAVEYIQYGMVVGLGSGSTASHAIHYLSRLCKIGRIEDIVGIPTSEQAREQALQLGIPLGDLDNYPRIDITIDGADAVDSNLNLINGKSGGLVRRKMVHAATKKLVIAVDESKLVDSLDGLAIPVEVVPFSWKYNATRLESLFGEQGCEAKLRMQGDEAFLTDDRNHILDLYFKSPIKDQRSAAEAILELEGVVEHGLFLSGASVVVVAGVDGVFEKKK